MWDHYFCNLDRRNYITRSQHTQRIKEKRQIVSAKIRAFHHTYVLLLHTNETGSPYVIQYNTTTTHFPTHLLFKQLLQETQGARDTPLSYLMRSTSYPHLLCIIGKAVLQILCVDGEHLHCSALVVQSSCLDAKLLLCMHKQMHRHTVQLTQTQHAHIHMQTPTSNTHTHIHNIQHTYNGDRVHTPGLPE